MLVLVYTSFWKGLAVSITVLTIAKFFTPFLAYITGFITLSDSELEELEGMAHSAAEELGGEVGGAVGSYSGESLMNTPTNKKS